MTWFEKLGLKERPEFVIGSDENGTGAWAGPILVTACVFPFTWEGFNGLMDSKKYGAKKNKVELFRQTSERIYREGLTFSQFYLMPEMIDQQGMHKALLRGHRLVIKSCLKEFPGALVIVDGNLVIPDVDHLAIPKADDLVPAVSAASVLGKVERDWWMNWESSHYPQYGFQNHVGYGTEEHRRALEKHGPCPIHRKSYRPIQRYSR